MASNNMGTIAVEIKDLEPVRTCIEILKDAYEAGVLPYPYSERCELVFAKMTEENAE